MDRVTRLLLLVGMAILLPSLRGGVSSQTSAAGGSHTVVRTPDGSVWGWGLNNAGQLGHGTNTSRSVPTVSNLLSDVIAVAAGSAHTLVLKSDGTVWSFGSNFYGQLGDGTFTNRSSPVLVTGPGSVVAIAAGANHSVALASDGSVWTWGRNANGQLGVGNTTGSNQPLVVSSLSAIAIGAGWDHTLAVKTDGSVAAWGGNANGQLGDASTTQRTSPVVMSGISTAVAATGGSAHSLILLADGTVKSAGANSSGALGDGTTTQRTSPVSVTSLSGVSRIAAGQHSSYAVKTDGTVHAWGGNGSGRLGDGSSMQRNSPVAIAALSGVTELAAGNSHALAVTSTGVVYTWGSNASSVLGDGTTASRSAPVAISEGAYLWKVGTPILTATGSQWTERSVSISSATPGATIHYTTNGDLPTELDPMVTGAIGVAESQTVKARAFKTGHAASEVASASYTLVVATPVFSPSGGTYTSARTVTISTTSPGVTIRYTLDGSTPTESSPAYVSALTVGTTTTVKAIGFRSGWTSSSTSTATYTMNFGTLAAPVLSSQSGTYEGSVLLSMSAQDGATIRYTTNGSTPTSSSTIYTAPLTLTTTATIKAKAFHPEFATSPESVGTYTIVVPAPTLSLGSGTYAPGTIVTVGSIDAGATLRFTLTGSDPTSSDPLITAGTTLLVGGYTLKVRAFRTGAVDSQVTAASYGLTEPLSTGALAVGDQHTVLATPEGLLFAWGANGASRLGDGTTTNRTVPTLIALTGAKALAAGGSHTLAVTFDGRVFAWGANTSGQLGDGTTTTRARPVHITGISNVVRVAAGASHSLAVTSDGFVYAWGSGANGRLGLGSTTSQTVPTLIPGLENVTAVAAGGSHSFALTANGALYGWGLNSSYQLGDGTTTSRTVPTLITVGVPVLEIAAGANHSVARGGSGAVYVWGSGSSGQLGLGNTSNRTSPALIPGLIAVGVAAGGTHSVALRADGALVAWGANGSGQLGDGSTTMRTVPSEVAMPPTVALFGGGGLHSVAVTPDGNIWTWGSGTSGRLGDGTTTTRPTPESVFVQEGAWGVTPTPFLTLAPGTYHDVQTANVVAPADATLHYNLLGIVPTESDPVLPAGEGIAIDRNAILTVRAWRSGRPGPPAVATYELQPVPPVITPGSGTYTTAQTVVIQGPSGAIVRYTQDDTEPTPGSPVYDGPLGVDRSIILRARAFREGWTPSSEEVASYTFNHGTLPVPSATPPGGTYSPSVAVALQAAEAASIRYTTDSSVPTASSPLYTGPIPIAASLTLKARAFKDGWTSSPVLTETYTIQLPAPVASPTGGWYASPQQVSLHSAPNATIRYTLNGGQPTAESPQYEGPFVVSGTTVVRARAFQSGMVASTTMITTFEIDDLGPTITPHFSTAPSSSGWFAGPVSVTFTCADSGSGVNSCPASTAFDNEGFGQTVSVSAVDNVGNVSILAVPANIDRTPPTTLVVGPEDGHSVEHSTQTISATVSDALSGLDSATCNGNSAEINGDTLACTVSLDKGVNPILIHVRDRAGNDTSTTIRVTRIAAAEHLFASPNRLTLLVSESARVHVRTDVQGEGVGAPVWSSADESIAQVDGTGTVTAVGFGSTTVTAGLGALATTVTVTVLPGTTFPVGTLRWFASPTPAFNVYGDFGAVGMSGFETTFASLEVRYNENYDPVDTHVRGFDADGRETFRTRAPLAVGERVNAMVGHAEDGTLLLVDRDWWDPQSRPSLIRVGSAADTPVWRSTLPRLSSPVSVQDAVAQDHLGTIFIAADGLLGIDGRSGTKQFHIPPPMHTVTYAPNSCGLVDREVPVPFNYVVVDAEGFANVAVARVSQTHTPTFGCNTSISQDAEVLLYRVSSDGSYTVTKLAEYNGTSFRSFTLGKPIPDETGGVMARWSMCLPIQGTHEQTCEYRGIHVAGGTPSSEFALPPTAHSMWEMVAGAGQIAYVGGPTVKAIDMRTGAEVWTAATGGTPAAALQGGAVAVWQSNSTSILSATGQLLASGLGTNPQMLDWGLRGLLPGFASSDTWIGGTRNEDGEHGLGAITVVAAAVDPESAFPMVHGSALRNNAQPLPNTIFVYLNFKAGWQNSLEMDGLTASELAVVRETARTTFEEGFQGYAVTAILGTIENAKIGKYNRRIDIDGLLSAANGETTQLALVSFVHMGTLFSSFKSALDCGEGNDCRATDFGAIPQKTGLGRGQLVTALGRGVGATAAHEMGHQTNFFKGVKSFTFHTTTCRSCYDYTLPDGTSRYPREQFFGPLTWSQRAQEAMRSALPRKP